MPAGAADVAGLWIAGDVQPPLAAAPSRHYHRAYVCPRCDGASVTAAPVIEPLRASGTGDCRRCAVFVCVVPVAPETDS